MSELISQGSIIAVVGYLLVFVVLAVIWGVLEISKLFFTKADNTKQAKEAHISPALKEEIADGNAEDDDELIAVLTAAIAASLGRTSTYNLNIKSYRRIGSTSPVWNQISRRENLS